ncbi:Crp/Fnr family transcriptional regulator [Fusibacter ferrireducens]|uniref:Crp/Fnr family transcriptional regulator n=1 Tax=Fusibacter ferrireducens TaxID=2785058 RepID=A0ABR9ZV43_9FIRM|nr:Crp/Fnr family transcriptional regulator [Fusibacter ferrireducens]MBF4694221.1 Crp/Fnr family transcriptional regulator [Fusibacter ferrireducens]
MKFIYNQKFNREEYALTRQTFLKVFSAVGELQCYKRGTTIQIAFGEEIMLITGGRAKVMAYSENGHSRLLYILSSGDLFGEIDSYVEHSPDIDVISLTDIQAVMIPTQLFKATLLARQGLYDHLILSIIRKYQIIRSQLSDTAFRDSHGKIAALLLRICSQEGIYRNGYCEFHYLKHHEIASLAGCSRVTVTRILHDFISQGILGIEKDKMILYSEALLRQQLVQGTRN